MVIGHVTITALPVTELLFSEVLAWDARVSVERAPFM